MNETKAGVFKTLQHQTGERFVHDSLRRFSRSRSMQLVINSALERNSLAKRERLEKSCWNASCTPICKMLVVSLDFFPFIILSNIRSLSLLICFATTRTTTAALTDCLMMNQKGNVEKRETFFLFAVVNYSSTFPSLLIDSECFIDNQWKICLMSLRYARVLARNMSGMAQNTVKRPEWGAEIGFDLCNAFGLISEAIVSCFWLLGHCSQIWLLQSSLIWETGHVLLWELFHFWLYLSVDLWFHDLWSLSLFDLFENFLKKPPMTICLITIYLNFEAKSNDRASTVVCEP